MQNFDQIYHLNLKGDARTSGELRRREGGNIFNDQVRVGIGITLLIRTENHDSKRLNYAEVPDYWGSSAKTQFLEASTGVLDITWQNIVPDERHTWLIPKNAEEFATLIPIGSKTTKTNTAITTGVIFKNFSLGIATNRDNLVYAFDTERLKTQVETFIEIYNSAVDKLKRLSSSTLSQSLIDPHDSRIKWTRQVKASLEKLNYSKFSAQSIRHGLYRPYSRLPLYFDNFWNEERYQQHLFFPTPATELENKAIALTTLGSEKPFMALITDTISDLHLVGAGSGSQCFPFYIYDEHGSNRRENITDWALKQFQDHYGDPSITKWDIFYYVYGVLHHPEYREKFADNLKRELPHIPFAPELPADTALTPSPSPAGEGNLSKAEVEPKNLVSKVMIEIGRDLRQRHTSAEVLLWEYVRDRKLGSMKVRRQHPIPETNYIVDYYCHESRLVIELDGSIHEHQQAADANRQQELESLGYHVLRFTNDQVFQNLETVLTTILATHRLFLPAPKLSSPAGEESLGAGFFRLPRFC